MPINIQARKEKDAEEHYDLVKWSEKWEEEVKFPIPVSSLLSDCMKLNTAKVLEDDAKAHWAVV